MRALLAQLGHYARRFFGFFRLQPLSPSEQDVVASELSRDEAALFWSMQSEDQRHCFDMARCVHRRLPGDREAIRAALLHDVGKSQAQLGPVMRSVATVAGHMHLPMTAAMRHYWNHGPHGAFALADAGSSDFVVEFARDHAKRRAVQDPRWAVLVDCDS